MSDQHPQYKDLLPLLDSGELTQDEEARLQAHLRSCETCRREAILLQQVPAIIGQPPPDGWEADVLPKVNAKLATRLEAASRHSGSSSTASADRTSGTGRARSALAMPGRLGGRLTTVAARLAVVTLMLLMFAGMATILQYRSELDEGKADRRGDETPVRVEPPLPLPHYMSIYGTYWVLNVDENDPIYRDIWYASGSVLSELGAADYSVDQSRAWEGRSSSVEFVFVHDEGPQPLPETTPTLVAKLTAYPDRYPTLQTDTGPIPVFRMYFPLQQHSEDEKDATDGSGAEVYILRPSLDGWVRVVSQGSMRELQELIQPIIDERQALYPGPSATAVTIPMPTFALPKPAPIITLPSPGAGDARVGR